MYPSSVLISSSKMRRLCKERSTAALSKTRGLSKPLLSSEHLWLDSDALLLRSVCACVREDRKLLRLDRLKTLPLARLTLAVLTASTKPNEDPEDDWR